MVTILRMVIVVLVLLQAQAAIWLVKTGAVLAPAGKKGSTEQTILSFFIQQEAALASRGLLRCCAEWTRTCSWTQSMATFLETKRVAGEYTVAVPCCTMTLRPIPSHTEQTTWSPPLVSSPDHTSHTFTWQHPLLPPTYTSMAGWLCSAGLCSVLCPQFPVLVRLLQLVLLSYWAGEPCTIPVGRYNRTKPSPTASAYGSYDPGSTWESPQHNGGLSATFSCFWSYFIYLKLGFECLNFFVVFWNFSGSNGLLLEVAVSSLSSTVDRYQLRHSIGH